MSTSAIQEKQQTTLPADVYAIQSRSGRIYVGQTQDFETRLVLHNQGKVSSTRGDRPWTVRKIQPFDTREAARYFEHCLKKSRGKREKWLNNSC